MSLDTAAAASAVAGLATTLSLEPLELAEGILDVINAKMAQAIRTLTVAQGIEPRDFALVAFGGAGPMHAAFLAEELEIDVVVVPRFPGAFSAWGMLETDLRRDFRRSFYAKAAAADLTALAEIFRLARGRGPSGARRRGRACRRRPRVEHSLDMRYEAQEYTLTIPAGDPLADGFVEQIAQRFHEAHDARYGHSNPGAPVEFVTARTTLLGELGRAAPEQLEPARVAAALAAARPCSGAGAGTPAVVSRDELARRALRPRDRRRADGDDRRPAGLDAARRRARHAAAHERRRGRLMATTTVDPITTEVIRNALNSAAEEMNATLFRSAYTWIIYELRDCSVALLDADHRVLGQSSGLPIFLGNLEVCTKLTEETYGRDAWEPGDVWALNDSYLAGTHLNDVTVFSPIFHDGQLIGFGASRAHWLDVGAKDPGSPMDSTDIWQEGLRMGPIKVADGGRVRPDIVDLLGRNSRFSYPARGDLMAQIACARTGEKRLRAIVERFGLETVHAARDAIFEQTERVERAAVAAIPDGVYEAEGCIDNDGLDDTPVSIRREGDRRR